MALDLVLCHAGITIRIQQDLFGDERRAFAIHVNRAALVDDKSAISIVAFDLEDFVGHEIVLVPGKVEPARESSPGVEAPVDTSPFAALIGHERRSYVAHPRIVVGHLDDAHMRRELRACEFEVRSGRADSDRFEPGDGGSHIGEGLLRRQCAQPPVVGPFRPEHPATCMRGVLGGHGKAIGERCGVESSGHVNGL